MRVTKVTYGRKGRSTTKAVEDIELEVTVDEGESVQTAIRRARITAKIALGEMPTGIRATNIAARMRADASNLMEAAADLSQVGFE